jgi:hypothetical protein
MHSLTPATQQAILSYQVQLDQAIANNAITQELSDQLLDWLSDQIEDFNEYEQACMYLGLA